MEAGQNAGDWTQDASQRTTGKGPGRRGIEESRGQGVEDSSGGCKALFRCDLGTGESALRSGLYH